MAARSGSDLSADPVETPTGRTLRLLTEEATARERERCALIADNAAFALPPGPLYSAGFVAARKFIAARIRGDVG